MHLQQTTFSKFRHSQLATICDAIPTRATSKQPAPVSSVNSSSAFSTSPPPLSSIMARSRDSVSCCLLLPDWLDYACSVVSMRFGGYTELEDELPASRTLNVRFHDDDCGWVDQHLRPVVQERLKFFQEVSYGDKTLRRDDVFVFDRFKDDLEISFKTVFIISRSSLADANFMSMVRVSLQHINRVRFEKVLLIFLDSLTDLAMPFGIRFYVDRQLPYLVWPEGESKRLYFWKKFAKWTTINKRMTIVLPERCYLESPWYP